MYMSLYTRTHTIYYQYCFVIIVFMLIDSFYTRTASTTRLFQLGNTGEPSNNLFEGSTVPNTFGDNHDKFTSFVRMSSSQRLSVQKL